MGDPDALTPDTTSRTSFFAFLFRPGGVVTTSPGRFYARPFMGNRAIGGRESLFGACSGANREQLTAHDRILDEVFR
ncbi:hypothetical protein [Streptomyces niveus]